ncbi:hypothetical protein [Vibrio owensii]|uniref:hypothetical protein n=1 Tax=Vibrio owensii TaxID=696485 RepID=UPI00221E7D16|nr:hypothetical protein [Vibrio owensii]
MRVKQFLASLLVLVSAFSLASEPNKQAQNEATINAFFAQYQLLGEQGFDAFAKARETLFSNDSKTLVNDVTATEYKGKAGHLESIKDWFEIYQTQDDFSYRIAPASKDGRVKVELFGTLIQTQDGQSDTINPDGHRWTEYFTFNEAGEIALLQIDMNVLSKTYDAEARSQLSQNDIASFVYQWFAGFDHQRESGYFLARIAEPVDMAYPDFPIQSYQDFLRWYKGVTDNIVWNSHDIQGLTIKGDQNSGWAVSYDVVWKAKAKNGDNYDMRVHQDLKIILDSGSLKIAQLRAKVL